MENNSKFDITKYINDDTIRKAAAIHGVIKGAMLIFVCVAALASPMFRAMKNSGDSLLVTFSHGFVILLILLALTGVFMFVRNLLALILQLTGKEETEFGQKYLMFMTVMEASAGDMIAIVFGSLFIILSLFAIITGGDNLAEGSSATALYIISGVFCIAGLSVVIHGIVGTVKNIKSIISIKNEGHF